MAQVSTLPTAAPVYVLMDAKAFSQAVKDVARKASFQSSKYEVLQDKARRVEMYGRQLESLFRDQLPALQSEIHNADGTAAFEQIKEIDDALADASLDKESRLALQEERSKVSEDLSQSLSSVAKEVADMARAIVTKVGEIEDVIIAERTDGPLQMEKNRRAEMLAAVAAKEAERKGVEADRSKLVAAQDIIRSRNIVDMFKDYIPTEDDLKNIDLSKPEVAAVMQGVALVRKVLDNVSEGVKYIELANARKALDVKYDALTADITAANAFLESSTAVLADLQAVLDIDERKKPLITEASKFGNACAAFAAGLAALSGGDVSAAALGKVLGLFDDYLGNTAHSFSKVVLL